MIPIAKIVDEVAPAEKIGLFGGCFSPHHPYNLLTVWSQVMAKYPRPSCLSVSRLVWNSWPPTRTMIVPPQRVVVGGDALRRSAPCTCTEEAGDRLLRRRVYFLVTAEKYTWTKPDSDGWLTAFS